MSRQFLLPIISSLFVVGCNVSPITTDPLAGQSKEDAPSVSCKLTSVDGNQEVPIEFINSSNRTVAIYWLDYEGEEVFYRALRSRESYELQTYVTHPWCMRDAETGVSILAVTVESAEPQVIRIP